MIYRSIQWYLISGLLFVYVKGTLKSTFQLRPRRMVPCSCMSFWLATTGHSNGNICSEMGQQLFREFYWPNMLYRRRRHLIYSEIVWVFNSVEWPMEWLVTFSISSTCYRRLNRRLRQRRCRLRGQWLTLNRKYSSICLSMTYQCPKLTFHQN